jgi:hypothetical protein
MNEAEIVTTLRAHFESLFPKRCPVCKRVYPALAAYIRTTKQLGPTISYDVSLHDWKPTHPLGTFAHANCPCGNTLCVCTEGMGVAAIQGLLSWLSQEKQLRNADPELLLEHLRNEIRLQVLAESPCLGFNPPVSGPF